MNSSLRSASYKMLFKCLSNIHGRPKSTSEFLTCSAVKDMIQEFTFLSKVAHSDDFLVSCFKKTAISILSSFLVIMCIYLFIWLGLLVHIISLCACIHLLINIYLACLFAFSLYLFLCFSLCVSACLSLFPSLSPYLTFLSHSLPLSPLYLCLCPFRYLCVSAFLRSVLSVFRGPGPGFVVAGARSRQDFGNCLSFKRFHTRNKKKIDLGVNDFKKGRKNFWLEK